MGQLPFEECKICNIWELLPNNFKWHTKSNVWKQKGSGIRLKEFDSNL
jgi:hypothetical protein